MRWSICIEPPVVSAHCGPTCARGHQRDLVRMHHPTRVPGTSSSPLSDILRMSGGGRVSEVEGYALVVAAIFALNLLPAFGPPTWAVLVLFTVHGDYVAPLL